MVGVSAVLSWADIEAPSDRDSAISRERVFIVILLI
jgi:hypothetical protein